MKHSSPADTSIKNTPSLSNDESNDMQLYRVTLSGDLAAITSLIQQGADPRVIGPAGWTLLHAAAFINRADILRFLIVQVQGIETNVQADNGQTPLHIAAYWSLDHLDTTQLLLEHGAEINARDHKNRTPLRIALQECHEHVAALLRQLGGSE